MNKRHSGFTLIELMITVAIIAIIAAVAFPGYQDQVRKSRRSAAKAVLTDIAAKQQQYLLDARTYTSSLSELAVTPPAEVTGYYNVSVSGATATAFTVVAAPINGQENDLGGQSLTLSQAGVKNPPEAW